jgi:hypothetical protein
MLKFFRDKDQLSIFLISIITLIFWYLDLKAGVSLPDVESGENSGPLGIFLINILQNAPFFYSALCYILLIMNAFLLVRLNTKFILTVRRTQLPALFFIISLAGFTNLTAILLPLVACLFFCIALDRMFSSYKKGRLAYNFFDASFLITLASFFYVPAFLFNLIVFFGLSKLRPINWREWMLSILGILVPFFIYHSIVFLIEMTINISIINRIEFASEFFFPWNSQISYFYLSLLCLLLIISSVDIATGFQLKKIIARKVYIILFGNFILSVFLFFIIKNIESGVLIFTSASLGYLFSHYFALIRFNWFREIVFNLLLLLVLAKKLLPLIM